MTVRPRVSPSYFLNLGEDWKLPPGRKIDGTPQFGSYGNLLSHFFGKNFVKVTVLLKNLLDS